MLNYTADTNRLLRATENSIKQTEEHFGIQNRPYVSILNIIESDNDETKSHELFIHFKNYGNTPAYNVNVEAKVIADGVPNKADMKPNARGEGTIFPQRELFYKFSINFSSKYPLTKEDFLKIEMLVKVQYSSMGKKHYTNERLFWDGGKTLVFNTLENN